MRVIPVTTACVQRIRVGRHPGGLTRVVLDLTGPARYSVYSLYNPYRIVIDVEAAAQASAAPPAPTGPVPVPARTMQQRRPVALSWPSARAQAASASLPVAAEAPVTPPAAAVAPPPVSEPPIVTVAAESAAPPGTPAPATAAPTARGDFSLSRQLGLGIARIVIDAGHGGHDPGAQGPGLSEADLTLDIALRLEELLRKQPGVEVVQTRRTNAYVSLEERTEIANRAGADLFLSIHANASTNPRARGVETYFLNFAPTPEAEAHRRARERRLGAGRCATCPTSSRRSRSTTRSTSRAISRGSCRTSLFAQLQEERQALRNLGVKQAPFMVLIGATMPSVLDRDLVPDQSAGRRRCCADREVSPADRRGAAAPASRAISSR